MKGVEQIIGVEHRDTQISGNLELVLVVEMVLVTSKFLGTLYGPGASKLDLTSMESSWNVIGVLFDDNRVS